MAKDNIFEQDLQLQGIAKILNLRLDVLASITGEPIAGKKGGMYFNSTENSIRVNVDTTNWYNTLLAPVSLTAETFKRLPLLTANKQNYVEAMTNSTSDKLLYLDLTGVPTLVEKINFTHFLDPAIYTDDYLDIATGETLLPTAGAVYDYMIANNTSLEGIYLKLAGGDMVGDIVMKDDNRINFFDNTNYITSLDNSAVDINGQLLINLAIADNACLQVSSTSLLSAATNTYDIGSSSNKFQNAYFGTTVFTPLVSSTNLALTGSTDITFTGVKILKLDTNGFYPDTDGNTSLGRGTKRWAKLYSVAIACTDLTLAGDTITGILLNTTGITSGSTNAQLPTALAVWDLFDTIQPINTTTETYGTVVASPAVNPENYYLDGNNSWQSLTWLVSGTTLGLNSSLGITDFEFLADDTVAFGVRSNYTQLSYYDGSNIVLYLGDIGAALLTDYTYAVEMIGNLRTADSIWFGGTLSTAGVVEVKDDVISAISVLSISTAVLCTGISTDGTNIWSFEDVDNGAPTPDKKLLVTVNGNEYFLSAQLIVP